MPTAYAVKDDVIILHRDLTELDLFLKQFLDVLKNHCDYVVVSGYVSITTGRTRGTEDIDYKEIILGGNKDLDDAKHLRTFFSAILSEENFKKFEPIVRLELR